MKFLSGKTTSIKSQLKSDSLFLTWCVCVGGGGGGGRGGQNFSSSWFLFVCCCVLCVVVFGGVCVSGGGGGVCGWVGGGVGVLLRPHAEICYENI